MLKIEAMLNKTKMYNVSVISGSLFIRNIPSVAYYSKQAVILSKLTNKSKSRRHAWRDFEVDRGRPEMLPLPGTLTKGPHNDKRSHILNKLFMRHISDLMATGKCSEQIIGLGVQITKVKVSVDFSMVNIYWVSYGSVQEAEVISILSQCAGPLREELTSLRLIGKVPKITFVRDRSQTSWTQVENLLKIADMGDDYVPRGGSTLKNEFGNENTDSDRDLPAMRQNVLGVDREAILERILGSMKGRKMTVEKKPQTSVASQYQLFDQEAFASFLRQRKIMREKAEKQSEESLRSVESDESHIDHNEYLDAKYSDDEEEEDYLEGEDESIK